MRDLTIQQLFRVRDHSKELRKILTGLENKMATEIWKSAKHELMRRSDNLPIFSS